MPPVDLSPGEFEVVLSILARLLPGREVRVFGSRVTGTARKYSDLDLVVMGDAPLSLSLTADLEETFRESDLPFKVDVVDWSVTGESFRRIIAASAVVLQAGGPDSSNTETS